MFSAPTRLTAAASVSPLPNNLDVHFDSKTRITSYAFVSRNAVMVAEETPTGRDDEPPVLKHKVAYGTLEEPSYSKSLSVMQSRWLDYKGLRLLVVLAIDAIEIIDSMYSRVLMHETAAASHSSSAAELNYTRGACVIGDLLCCGCAAGEIIVFSMAVDPSTGKVKAEHKANLRGAHDAAVSTVVMDEHSAVATTEVVSTDVDGRIVVWDMSRLMPILETGGQLPMYIIASMESPVLSAVLRNGIVVVATFNGLISFFDLQTKDKVLEISAHARPINALAVDPAGTILASVGDDCRIMIWRFPDGGDPSSQLLFTASMTDRALNGVVIHPDTGAVVVSSYDSNQMLVFPLADQANRPSAKEHKTRL